MTTAATSAAPLLRSRLVATGCLVALLLLAACGTPATQHGAPPYQSTPDQQTTNPHIARHYADIGATFTLPPMAGADVAPMRAYVAFQVAVLRSLDRGRLDDAVTRWSDAKVRAQITGRIALDDHLGFTEPGPTKVLIRSISTTRYAELAVCLHRPGTVVLTGGSTEQTPIKRVRAIGVQLRMTSAGRWRVVLYAPLKHPGHTC